MMQWFRKSEFVAYPATPNVVRCDHAHHRMGAGPCQLHAYAMQNVISVQRLCLNLRASLPMTWVKSRSSQGRDL